jgi:hypothetical protein
MDNGGWRFPIIVIKVLDFGELERGESFTWTPRGMVLEKGTRRDGYKKEEKIHESRGFIYPSQPRAQSKLMVLQLGFLVLLR